MEKRQDIFLDNDTLGSIHGWQFVAIIDRFIEIWRTPTKFLTCNKYCGIFVFSNSEKEALEIAKKLAKTC